MHFPTHEEQQALQHTAMVLGRLDQIGIDAVNQRRFDASLDYDETTSTRTPSRAPSPLPNGRILPIDISASRPYRLFRKHVQRQMQTDPAAACVPPHTRKKYDLQAIAENKVREDWLQMGIWREEWGQAWPPESFPMSNIWRWTDEKALKGPDPTGPWSHEMMPDKGRSVHKLTRETGSHASRPYYQFVAQVSKLRGHENRGGLEQVDVDIESYRTIRTEWLQDGTWQPEWEFLPGMTWRHETCQPLPTKAAAAKKFAAPKATTPPKAQKAQKIRHTQLTTGRPRDQCRIEKKQTVRRSERIQNRYRNK